MTPLDVFFWFMCACWIITAILFVLGIVSEAPEGIALGIVGGFVATVLLVIWVIFWFIAKAIGVI